MKSNKDFFTKALTLLLVISLFACSKDSDPAAGSTYKITVMLNEVNASNNYVSITTVGNNQSGVVTYPLWRLNGTDQANIQTLSLDKNDFTGNTKTYVMETVSRIQIFSAGVQIINYGPSLTGSFKIEKNGSTVVNETINLTGDNSDFTKNYSFND